jgi:two-component system chemotaxis response regulator CheY
MEPRKILIVDDEPALSALLCEALELEGPYRVDKASNGLEGVEKYKEFSPDLVIMDMNMPVMNGYDSSRKIKSYDQDARILVLTGNPSDVQAKKTIKQVKVKNFTPSRNGFKFPNRFPGVLLPDPLQKVIDSSNSVHGLCGGMCFTVIDHVKAGKPLLFSHRDPEHIWNVYQKRVR